MSDRQTQAERWLDRIGMDDGQVYRVPGQDPGVRIDLLLDGTLEMEGWPEDVLALQPEASVNPTTVYVGDSRSAQDAYLWPDGSGIVDFGAWWDLVDMSREDPWHRSESGEPIHRTTRVQDLLSMLTLTLADISEGSGIPLDTLKSWSSGRSTPRPEGHRELAGWARRHATELLAMAHDRRGGEDG